MSLRGDGSFDINVRRNRTYPQQHSHSAVTRVFHVAYGCYAWVALLVIVVPLCVVLAVLPGVERRRRLARGAARLVLLRRSVAPCASKAAGIEPHYPCVVVANHSSYLDGIILTAALPAGFTYLIKYQMAACPLRASCCGGSARPSSTATIGTIGTERRAHAAHARHARLCARLLSGRHVRQGAWAEALPPRRVQRRSAREAARRARRDPWGALEAAVRARCLPRPGRYACTSATPVRLPPSDPTAHALMTATRRAMLAHLDEPDLAPEARAYIPE